MLETWNLVRKYTQTYVVSKILPYSIKALGRGKNINFGTNVSNETLQFIASKETHVWIRSIKQEDGQSLQMEKYQLNKKNYLIANFYGFYSYYFTSSSHL